MAVPARDREKPRIPPPAASRFVQFDPPTAAELHFQIDRLQVAALPMLAAALAFVDVATNSTNHGKKS